MGSPEKAAVKVTARPYVDGEPEVDTVNVGTIAFRFKAKISEILPSLAVRVAVCAVPTAETVAVNPALAAPAGTVTVLGTVTAELLLDKFTIRPPLGAEAVSVTVQGSAADPIRALLVQLSELKVVVLAAAPVPLRPIAIVPLLEALLAIIS